VFACRRIFRKMLIFTLPFKRTGVMNRHAPTGRRTVMTNHSRFLAWYKTQNAHQGFTCATRRNLSSRLT
jgi:hypothetical protein